MFLNLCSSSCGDQDILLVTVDLMVFRSYSYCLVVSITTIGIRAMASKTTTTKFEVEKFDGKNNFLLWKMRKMALFVK